MIYCDTSLLVATLTPERHSDVARQWLDSQTDKLAISAWIDTEVASALAQKERLGTFPTSERLAILALWRRSFAAAVEMAEVQLVDFRRASELVEVGRRGLRASDALHLAIADRHRWAIATLDDDLAAAAAAIGLVVPAIVRD